MNPNKVNYTPYLGVTGPNAAFRPGKPRHVEKMDQHAAVVVVENSDVLWTEPRDIPLEKVKKGDALRWYGNKTIYLRTNGTSYDWDRNNDDVGNNPPNYEFESGE